MTVAALLDERARPDFRDTYELYARRAATLDVAVRRIRLSGVTLGDGELGGLARIRLLVGELRLLAVASEAEAMAADEVRRPRLALLLSLLREGRLQVRISPLAGWNPDFSVFSGGRGDGSAAGAASDPAAQPTVLMVGPHWFERPYPHPGPAFGVAIEGVAALLGRRRFEELWRGGHDLRPPVEAVLADALRRRQPGG